MFRGSLWILIANVLAYRAWNNRQFVALALWVLIPIGSSFLVIPTLSEKENVKVVVVQPNIDPYGEKFGSLSADEQLEKLLILANEKVDSTTDYLIGPETALTDGLWENVGLAIKVALDLGVNIKIIKKTLPKIKFEGRVQFIKGKLTKP